MTKKIRKAFAVFFCLILFLSLFLFLFGNVRAAAPGTGEGSVTIEIEGCADATKCWECSRSAAYGPPYLCNCSKGISPQEGSQLQNNFCFGYDGKVGTSDDCGCPGGSYCIPEKKDKAGSCASAPGDCKGSNWEDCVTSGAGCYYENNTCKTCEPAGDKNCNNYGNNGSCISDICGYGKHGLGSVICLGAEDCGCVWDGSKCGLNATTEEGESCTYTYTALGPCVNETATWEWEKICGSVSTIGSEKVDCGKAISPLPFFTLTSFLFCVALLFLYYTFLIRKSKKGFVK